MYAGELHVGDRVRGDHLPGRYSYVSSVIEKGTVGYRALIKTDCSEDASCWTIDRRDTGEWGSDVDDGELWLVSCPHTTNSMKNSNLVSKKVLPKDVQTLVESGVLNRDLSIADSGFVLSFVVNQFTAELAKEAKALVEETKTGK